MRVLLVSDYPPGPTGGAEVQVGRLASSLTDVGCEVRVACGDGSHVGMRKVLDLWDPGARARLRRLVHDFAPDVVHYHNILNELSTSVVGVGAPSVLTVHDPRMLGTRFGHDQDRSPFVPGVALRAAKDRVARVRLRRHVDAAIAPNPVLASRLRAAGFPSVHHVENITPITGDGRLGTDVVFAGAVATHKGVQVLLDAWARIESRHPQVRLRIVGDGPDRSAFESSVREAGLEHRVVFSGRVEPDEVVASFAAAAIVVVPSLGAETQPMVVLEALAAGRPVIASRWPGAESTITDEVGVLVAPGDALSLSDHLHRLLDDRERAERMGSAALDLARSRWSPEVGVPAVLEVYRSVIG